jgi:hypothetical protein
MAYMIPRSASILPYGLDCYNAHNGVTISVKFHIPNCTYQCEMSQTLQSSQNPRHFDCDGACTTRGSFKYVAVAPCGSLLC